MCTSLTVMKRGAGGFARARVWRHRWTRMRLRALTRNTRRCWLSAFRVSRCYSASSSRVCADGARPGQLSGTTALRVPAAFFAEIGETESGVRIERDVNVERPRQLTGLADGKFY